MEGWERREVWCIDENEEVCAAGVDVVRKVGEDGLRLVSRRQPSVHLGTDSQRARCGNRSLPHP